MSVHFKYHQQVPKAEFWLEKYYFSMENFIQTNIQVSGSSCTYISLLTPLWGRCHPHLSFMKEETKALEKCNCWLEVTQLVNDGVRPFRPWPKSVYRFYNMTSPGNYWGDTAWIGLKPSINRTRILYEGIQFVVLFVRSFLKGKCELKGFSRFPLSYCTTIRRRFAWPVILNTDDILIKEFVLQVDTEKHKRIWFQDPFWCF